MMSLENKQSNSVEEDHSDFPYYDNVYMIPTTNEQDAIISKSALQGISRPYNLLFDNCAHTVLQSLNSAGVPTIDNILPCQVAGSSLSYYLKKLKVVILINKRLYLHSDEKRTII